MKRKRRSIVGLLLLLCSCTLLVVACGSHSQPSTKHSASNLDWKENKSNASSRETGTPTTNVTGEYLGSVSNTNTPTWIALASDGKHLVALVSDGTENHDATFAQWFKGSIQNNNAVAEPVYVPKNAGESGTATPSTTPEATPGATSEATPTVEMTPGGTATVTAGANQGSSLTATLTSDSASGTVVLNNGRSFPFNAHRVSNNAQNAVLYRGEATNNGTTYVGGWIVQPNSSAGPSSTATPGATMTPESGTPSATATQGTQSATPGATGTATEGVTMPKSTGVIINEQTGQVMQAPALTAQDIASKQVKVPNIGTFNLKRCQQGQC